MSGTGDVDHCVHLTSLCGFFSAIFHDLTVECLSAGDNGMLCRARRGELP